MQKFLKKLSYCVFLFHKGILLFSLLVTILATLLIFRITIKTDIFEILPANNPFIKKYVDFLNDFGSIDNLVIAIESDESSADTNIEFAELLVEKLQTAPFVKEIDYNIFNVKGKLFINYFPLYIDNRKSFELLKEKLKEANIRAQIRRNRYRLISPFSSPFDNEVIFKDPLNIRDILKKQLNQKGLEGFASKGGYYISRDNSTLLIFIEPTKSSRDMGFVIEMKKELDIILSETLNEYGNPENLHIGYTGTHAFAAEAHQVVKKDIFFSFISSAVLIILLFQFIYRTRPMMLLIIASTLLTSLSWTLGVAYLLFGGLNLVSSIVAAMLMGLGIDYVVHIFKRFEREFVETGDSRKALETTLSRTGVGVITGAITTALAFFCIVFTSFNGLHELGIVAGLGVFSCLFTTMLVMTSLLVLLGKTKPHLLYQRTEKGMGTKWIAKGVITYTKPIQFIGIFFLIIALMGLPKVSFDTTPQNMGLKNSHAMALENRIAEKFGRQKNPLIILGTKKTENELFASFDTLETKLEQWEKENVIESYTSLGLFIPPLSKQFIALKRLQEIRQSEEIDFNRIEKTFLTALKENGFAQDVSSKNYIIDIRRVMNIDKPIGLAKLNEGPINKVRHFYNKKNKKLAAYIFPKNGRWEERELEAIKHDLSGLGKDWDLLGSALMFRELKDSIILESSIAGSIAFVVIFSMLYMQFQSIKKVGLVLLPLALGFIYTMGLMGFLNIKFNYINIGIVTLIFGIGVDYGIYILHGFLEENRQDVKRTIEQVGKAVMMCGITTILGFGSLATMRFMGVASLGILICIGVVFCLFAALFFLPATLHSQKQEG